VQSLQCQLKILEASATSPLALVPLARQLLELARKSVGLPPAELQASLMLLASDALSKFDGSTAPPSPAQQPSVEAHPPPAPPSAAQARETAPPVVPPQPAAAPVTPVAEPRAKETPPQGGSTQAEEEETEGPQATANLNSAKAEAKLVKALDYLVAINDNSDNPAQKWVINESILASLTGCFRPAIKKFFETHRSFINQANNTHGLGTRPQPWQGKGRSGRYPSPG
jgi:hypothetical protein